MSKRDTEREFTRMARAAGECGLDVAGWQLHPGSVVNGVSWTIVTPIGASDLVGLPSFGSIGRTGVEAARFLAGMAAAFESVAYAERRKGEPR
jgi:hypothetical protein